MAKKLEKQVVVRVPDEMLEALQRDAAAHGRTVAQTVRFRLDQALSVATA